MTVIGYSRPLEAEDATAEGDIDRLSAAGANTVVADRKPDSHEQWDRLMGEIERGDVVLVSDLERIGSRLQHVVSAVLALDARGAHLEVIDSPVFESEPAAAVATLRALNDVRRRLIARTTRVGMEGKRRGRPPALQGEASAIARELHQQGRSIHHIARVLGVSDNAVRHALGESGPFRPTSSA